MMTRTTLKALWFGGGGVLATWLAVSPNQGVHPSSPAFSAQPPAAATQPGAEQLNAQAERLRQRTAAVGLRESTRNPFQFSSKPSGARVAHDRGVEPMVLTPPVPAIPPPPMLTLSGVAQKAGKRTAIITSNGQIYLAGEGDSFGGHFTVIKIDPSTVLIREAAGAEQRLVLPQ
jgi:hypothetical protein